MAHRSSPLLQTFVSQALLRHVSVSLPDRDAWQTVASEAIAWASKTQASDQQPADLVALWLTTLSWVSLAFSPAALSCKTYREKASPS